MNWFLRMKLAHKLLFAFLATVYPSWRASRVRPPSA